MRLLSIETSCDETAISILEAVGDFPNASYTILGNALFSQIKLHQEYGGVFPMLAKREHIATVVPMLQQALEEAELETRQPENAPNTEGLHTLLYREPGLAEQLLAFHDERGIPKVDAIAVTAGPGLEPALWVGVNFAKALASLWNIPVIPVDHMEGHILASIFDGVRLAPLQFPAIALLVSGGHTELILIKDWTQYERIGSTRDDAVGEAFDKVARLLGIPYPGGPEVSRRASEARVTNLPPYITLPRPMLHSGDLNFSFSGLKTAVRYAIADKTLTTDEIKALARDFEDAAVEVLIKKLKAAIDIHGAHDVILGGGVAANQQLRSEVSKLAGQNLTVHLPEISLSTDNSVMIALAGHAHLAAALSPAESLTIRADGNRSLTTE